MAVCVAVIAKENHPLFLRTMSPEEELKFHYTVHTSLDVVEEKVSSLTKSSNDPRELYLGLLYPTEDYKVCPTQDAAYNDEDLEKMTTLPATFLLYGYVTNTKIKFVVVVESANNSLRDNEIRMMFQRLHVAYTDMFCNPFYNPGENITSRRFEKVVENMMKQD